MTSTTPCMYGIGQASSLEIWYCEMSGHDPAVCDWQLSVLVQENSADSSNVTCSVGDSRPHFLASGGGASALFSFGPKR